MYFIVTLKNKEEKKLKKCKKLKKNKKKTHSKINYRPGHKWRPTQREYKWRSGTSKKNYRLGHPDTNHDREYKWRPRRRDTTTTGTPGAQVGYIIDDWDTGIVWIEITDRDTGTQMTTGTLGHREYKWRPGHSKRKYKLGHQDTNDDRDTGNINAIYMHRQWDSEECCIFACFT